ncbi:MAG: hypothetical protein Greene041619_763 [Candidatus Peregrinibacteria bacterium Greene0416_19]|nr:MAG: hypothetical protein Greene041619_763 [Candidatus Peregrinibacteria bacterium Greene0416_19]
MPPAEDPRALDTKALAALKDRLQHMKRVAEATPKGSNRDRKKLLRQREELGPFTTEKEEELRVATAILRVRHDARELCGQVLRPAPRRSPVVHQTPKILEEATFGSAQECLLRSTEEIREVWERGFMRMRNVVEAAGVPDGESGNIWNGLMEMHRHVFWLPWGTGEIRLKQDQTNLPIIFTIDPLDAELGGGRWGISTRLDTTGLNAHAAQQHTVTDEWAGIGMLKAHAHHLTTNMRLAETRQYTTVEQMESPAARQLQREIGSDACVAYMHALHLCSSGRLFPALKRILQEETITLRDKLLWFVTRDTFLERARELDRFFVDAPPLSPQEADERLGSYAWGLAFQLRANLENGGEPFNRVGTYDRAWCIPVYDKDTAPQRYRRMFHPVQENRDVGQQSETPIEDSAGERALRYWAEARKTARAIAMGMQPAGLPLPVAEIRGELVKDKDGLGMRVLEVVSLLDRWVREVSETGFVPSYARALGDEATAADLATVRDGLRDLVGRLQMQPFYDHRIEHLESGADELLLVTAMAARHAGAALAALAGPAALPDASGTRLSISLLHTLLRDTHAPSLAQQADLLCGRCCGLQMPEPENPAHDIIHAIGGLHECQEIEQIARALRTFLPSSRGETARAFRNVLGARHAFTYVLGRREQGTHSELLISVDPSQHATRVLSALPYAKIERASSWYRLREPPLVLDPAPAAAIDATGAVYGLGFVMYKERKRQGLTILGGPGPQHQSLIPPLAAGDRQTDLQTIRNATPVLLQQQLRDIQVICPDIPCDVLGKTIFVEFGNSLYARCQSADLASRYGTSVEVSVFPHEQGWLTVKLPTIADLERDYFSGKRSQEPFFPLPPATVRRGPRPPRECGGGGGGGEELDQPRRMRAVRDALLRNRDRGLHPSYAWDPGGEVDVPQDRPDQFNYSQTEEGHWTIITLRDQQRQIFVSDMPDRTYVLPRVEELSFYTRPGALTPQQLQEHGAKQIFYHSPEQFEASLMQALLAPAWTRIDAGSVEGLIQAQGDWVRGRLMGLIGHVNAQPDRKMPVTLETLKFGALRAHVESGKAPGETYCGHTIVAELARGAGYEDPLTYLTLRDFFDELMSQLNKNETGERHPASAAIDETEE